MHDGLHLRYADWKFYIPISTPQKQDAKIIKNVKNHLYQCLCLTPFILKEKHLTQNSENENCKSFTYQEKEVTKGHEKEKCPVTIFRFSWHSTVQNVHSIRITQKNRQQEENYAVAEERKCQSQSFIQTVFEVSREEWTRRACNFKTKLYKFCATIFFLLYLRY